MKKIIIMFSFLCFCPILFFNCTVSAKPSEERAIFTNETISVKGRTAGLPDDVKKVYISYFTDYIGNYKIMADFDRRLRYYTEQYGKITTVKMKNAHAIVIGSLTTMKISKGEELVTNIPSLYYLFILNYSVLNRENQYIQKDRIIKEEALVLDTNTYTESITLPILIDNAAKHTAEAIVFGWQLEYSKTSTNIFTLGVVTNVTNYVTNRKQ